MEGGSSLGIVYTDSDLLWPPFMKEPLSIRFDATQWPPTLGTLIDEQMQETFDPDV